MSKPSQKNGNSIIAQNKKARHDYAIELTLEAGVALEGWEVKSLRAGRAQLRDSYVIFKQGEAWLLGSHISPLSTVSTHIKADPTRTRKLLLHHHELKKFFGAVSQKNYTAIPLDLHWKGHLVKATIALGKGKKEHDKRETLKKRDWEREKQRLGK